MLFRDFRPIDTGPGGVNTMKNHCNVGHNQAVIYSAFL